MLSAGERSLIEREAACAGERILSMVGHEMIPDKDTGEYRPVRFGDIAVLFRSLAGSGEVYAQVFSDMGIPSCTGSGTGYFSAPEIRVMLSLLSVLDNPRQDIPLSAVMRSPIGGFTDEELAVIRTGCREQDFYTACTAFALREDHPSLARRIRSFLEDISILRDLVPGTSVQELLWRAMEVTGYGDYVLAMPGGRRRRANLDMLCEKAAAFEQGSYRGLFQFIRYIDNLKKYEVDYGINLKRPVESVSWDDCQAFLRKLNQLTGKSLRLPTEAEWEYAARGGCKSRGYKYSGSSTIGDVAWYSGNSEAQTHSVSTKQANELGIYDMSGNVWEWCKDNWYNYDGSATDYGSFRVYRGGSWSSDARRCRVSLRYYYSAGYRDRYLGLRLAL